MNNKKKRSTAKQLQMVVDFMFRHKDFANGKFTGPMGNQKNETLWRELADEISNHGPSKTATQCKITWRDLKGKVRAKNAQNRRARTTTGNTATAVVLSDADLKVLQIIGTESSEGVGEEESGLYVQATSESLIPYEENQPGINTEYLEMEIIEDVMEEFVPIVASTINPTVVNESTLGSTASEPIRSVQNVDDHGGNPVRQPRRAPFPEVDDVAKKYANLQDKNNEILMGMASTLADIQRHMSNRNEIERERNEIMKMQLFSKK